VDALGNEFTGISDSTTFVFTTSTPGAPTHYLDQWSGANPIPGAENVSVDTNLTFTFSEIVYAGSGSITIHQADSGVEAKSISLPSWRVTGLGTKTVTIDPAGSLDGDTSYYVNIDQGAFQDEDSNPHLGIATTTGWTFTTTTDDAPRLVSLTPADGSVGFSVEADIVLAFDEPVYPVENPSGPYPSPLNSCWFDQQPHIAIVKAGNGFWNTGSGSCEGAVADSVSVSDWRVSGWGTSTITIDRSGNPGGLRTDEAYYILIVPGSFVDVSGNEFPGIVDSTTWNFNADTAGPVPGRQSN